MCIGSTQDRGRKNLDARSGKRKNGSKESVTSNASSPESQSDSAASLERVSSVSKDSDWESRKGVFESQRFKTFPWDLARLR